MHSPTPTRLESPANGEIVAEQGYLKLVTPMVQSVGVEGLFAIESTD